MLYTIADAILMFTLLCALGGSAIAALHANEDFSFSSILAHKGLAHKLAYSAQFLVTIFLTVACAVLLYAFITFDFSVEYVAQYSDRTLPLFYRITALWAGRYGSMLFWAWTVAVSGTIFGLTPAYKRLSKPTQFWFWAFFLAIMSFFLLILTVWNAPFKPWPGDIPSDGYGLNPLLQNPGMIFHPPLLFLGYGGFVVPGCLALAQTVHGLLSPAGNMQQEASWGEVSRPFSIVAWLLLTAGIVLGSWWAYMELGWGGYWAWDPVENASLIPWLIGTAYLHTAVIESKRGKLRRVNVFLISLTTISAFFATYLVRSGVIESLHAFGTSEVGAPLLIFVLLFLALAIFISVASPRGKEDDLEDFFSKEGMLVLVAWVFITLSLVILLATIWPVIMNGVKWIAPFISTDLAMSSAKAATGLDAGFYNRICLPLFTILSLLLVVCPFRKWKLQEESFSKKNLIAICIFTLSLAVLLISSRMHSNTLHMLAVFAPLSLLFATGLFFFPLNEGDVTNSKAVQAVLTFMLVPAMLFFGIGVRQPTALIAAITAITGLATLIAYFGTYPKLLRVGPTLAAHGVHIGILLMFLGVAISGPYQAEHTIVLPEKQQQQSGEYLFKITKLFSGQEINPDDNEIRFHYAQADVEVYKNGELVGLAQPQRRIYAKFEKQTYAEVSTIFSLGNEVYATLLGIDEQNRATIMIRINPLVNWIWIGGILACLFPFLGLRTVRRKVEASATGMEA